MDILHAFELASSRGTKRSFFHRDSAADQGVIRQMFKETDYSLKRLKRAKELLGLYETMAESGNKPLIMDAGANIGASAVWFQLEYPHSHVVAFEPDAANFALLQLNAAGLNVDLRQAAIGSQDGRADIINPQAPSWGLRTEIKPDGACELISMSRIITEKIAAGYEPFIAKIDIEGGEQDLFADHTDWVDNFPVLIIELHDWLYPAEGTSRNFLRTISRLDRDFLHVGENIFSIANSRA